MRPILLATFASVVIANAQPSMSLTPTYAKDVAAILNKNCVSCHRPGDIAPMAFQSYEQVRPWAKSIREKVALGEMPPWHSVDARGTFSNDRRLSDKDKDILSRWANAGAPKGDLKDLPPAPKFVEGWEIGKPDAIYTMAKAYDVPVTGTVNYQYVAVPTNLTEDKWIQAIEVRPGARAVVHHVLVFCREPGVKPRVPPYTIEVPKMPISALRPSDPSNRERGAGAEAGPGTLIATTAPGTNAMIFEPGAALRIKAGAVLVLQLHYTTNGKATSDQTSVGMIFAKETPKQEVRSGAFINPLLVLPAGDNNKRVDSAIEFTEDSHVLALFPHTHLRGKSWEYRIVYPDGRKEVVLAVPKYDFNWQTYYTFAKPLALPKGARLEAEAHYDNSAANKWNPDPTKDVRWGEQTWQEMQYTGITYTVDKPKEAVSTTAANQ